MMRYSRYRVNYILWAVYGLVICIYFTVQTSLVCSMLGLGWMFYFLGTAGCAFLLILLVYLPIRTLAGMKNREKQCMPRSPRRSYVQEGARACPALGMPVSYLCDSGSTGSQALDGVSRRSGAVWRQISL